MGGKVVWLILQKNIPARTQIIQCGWKPVRSDHWEVQCSQTFMKTLFLWESTAHMDSSANNFFLLLIFINVTLFILYFPCACGYYSLAEPCSGDAKGLPTRDTSLIFQWVCDNKSVSLVFCCARARVKPGHTTLARTLKDRQEMRTPLALCLEIL